MTSTHFLRRCLPLGGIFLLAGGAASRSKAQEPITNYALFAGDVVTMAGPAKINTGIVGSNGNIVLGPSTECAGLEGGGKLQFSSTGGTTSTGPVTFNGDVALGVASKITGAINSGGNITVVAQSVLNGDVTAAQDIVIGQSGEVNGSINAGRYFSQGAFNKITGNVLANGGAIIGGTLNGNVTATQLNVPDGGQINGKAKQGSGTVTPAKYAAVVVPPADSFDVGATDDDGASDADDPLKPGKYGALKISDNHKLYLTSGVYYFSSVTFGQSSSIHLVNVTAQKGLHVFVAGDIKEALSVTSFVNGKAFADSDSTLAGKVIWEALGKFDQTESGNGGSDEWFGTIFTPTGRIAFGSNSKLTGSLISGGQITVGSSFIQTFIPSDKFAGPGLQ